MISTICALWRNFTRLVWRDRMLALEALLWSAAAAVLIAVLPFRYIRFLIAISFRQNNELIQADKKRVEVERIRRAVIGCARWVPWRAKCFQQGLAVHFMLRWRGLKPVLFYGVAVGGKGELSGHVWVRVNNFDVTGCELARYYTVLTTIPSLGEDGTSASSQVANAH